MTAMPFTRDYPTRRTFWRQHATADLRHLVRVIKLARACRPEDVRLTASSWLHVCVTVMARLEAEEEARR